MCCWKILIVLNLPTLDGKRHVLFNVNKVLCEFTNMCIIFRFQECWMDYYPELDKFEFHTAEILEISCMMYELNNSVPDIGKSDGN